MTTETEYAFLDHGKTIHIYRNGDIFFSPKKFVVNKRNRSFDTFLSDVTDSLKPPFGAVRRLHTPVNGRKITQLEEIVNGQRYVAVGKERFKRMGYESIPEGGIFKKTGQITTREIKPVVHSRLQASGRIRKIRNDPVTIFIYANGDFFRNAVRVLFKKRELQSWEQTLSAIGERLTLQTGAVRCLYALDGTLVEDVGSLKNAEFYVGVGTERFHKELIPHYGQHLPALQLSPRSERRKYLPPIMKTRRTKRKSNPASEISGSPNDSINSNKSKQEHKKADSEEDSVFHAKPVKHKRSSEKPQSVDYDKDEGGVYKSKHHNTETSDAAQVEENKDTRTDLPLDHVPAEEVKEDRDHENKRKSKYHNNPQADNKSSNEKSPTNQPKSEKNSSRQTDEKPYSVTNEQTPGGAQTEAEPATGTGQSPLQETSKDKKTPTKEEELAAAKIQAGVRGYQSRKRVKQQRKEETAALKIQTNVRGHQARVKVKKKQEEETAALKIQTNVRGHQARVKVKKKREKENAAASKIQAGYRGYQTRKDVKQKDGVPDEGSQNEPK